ncbi:MAG: histidine phosphatase family protein [Kiritimatiellae bacterium]|nr:histidine phosphatase family protein [Kiritimatiellia bacterium]
MRKRFLSAAIVCGACFLAPQSPALDLVIVRSAETRAEATGDDSAFNDRHFSEAGANQIAALTAELSRQAFDSILTSPWYSALRTIQPYLEATEQTAEFWPSLYECCRQPENGRKTSPPGLPILLEPEQHPFFLRRPDSPDVTPGDETNEEGAFRIKRAAAAIRNLWGGSDTRILIVMPPFAADRLARELTGIEFHLKSGQILQLQEQNGRFVVLRTD